jgi:hypothetical protein
MPKFKMGGGLKAKGGKASIKKPAYLVKTHKLKK